MSSPTAELEQVKAQVLQWSPQLRANLAERLFESLADEETASANLSESQIDEIVRRQRRHQNGEGHASDYRESLSRIDRALAEFRKA